MAGDTFFVLIRLLKKRFKGRVKKKKHLNLSKFLCCKLKSIRIILNISVAFYEQPGSFKPMLADQIKSEKICLFPVFGNSGYLRVIVNS